MERYKLDYVPAKPPRRTWKKVWSRSRFGCVSLVSTASVLVVFVVLLLGPDALVRHGPLSVAQWFMVMGSIAFVGGIAGVLGSDFDERRGMAMWGIALNFGLIVVGCVIWPAVRLAS